MNSIFEEIKKTIGATYSQERHINKINELYNKIKDKEIQVYDYGNFVGINTKIISVKTKDLANKLYRQYYVNVLTKEENILRIKHRVLLMFLDANEK